MDALPSQRFFSSVVEGPKWYGLHLAFPPFSLCLSHPSIPFHFLFFSFFFPVRITFGGANCSGQQWWRLKICLLYYDTS